jgi:nucleolar MIF4G domain-containing protein 1
VTEKPKTTQDSQKPLKSIFKTKTAAVEEIPSPPPSAKLSRAARDKLAQDDAEIAALEKRLGVKGKKKSKNAADGLDDIFGDLGGDFSDEEGVQPAKRKRDEDDDWLASKRRKALGQESSGEDDSDENGS